MLLSMGVRVPVYDIISTPAGDHQVFHAAHDVGGRQIDGCDARPAEAIQRHPGRARVPAGIECGHAPDAAALLALLGAATHDDVLDVRRVQVVALADGSEHLGQQALRMQL